MSVITTYLNDNAQIPLNRFVVYMLYSQLCNKYSDKSKRWNLGLSRSVASTAIGAISSSPSSILLIPPITACRDKIFSKSTVAQKNGSREQNHVPFMGDLSSLWPDLI